MTVATNETTTDASVQQLGRELWQRVQGEVPGIFNKGYWQGRILDWAMRDPSFKVDLFRFVDVLPSLQTTDQVTRHLKEYLIKEGRDLGWAMGAALKVASGGLGFGAGMAANQIRKNVTDMAQRFIVGTNAAEALPVLKKLYKEGFAFTVDLLGEATISDPEADTYQKRYLDLIENLVAEVSTWPPDPLIDRNHLGPIPRTNVSVKVSAMESHIDAADPSGSVERLLPRVLPLFLRAKERNVFLNVDLEQFSLSRITYDLFERLLMQPELKSSPHVGIVVQAYLKNSRDDLQRLIDLAKRRGAPITVRLVKGAYWDYEVVTAIQNGYECPVFTDKAATDANYETLSRVMLQNVEHIHSAFGSHNLRSLAHAVALAKELNVPPSAYEIQMLYGMAEPERAALRAMGHRVRLYAPVGEMLPGMAYLVRRLLENTSNSGFLKISHHDGVDVSQLMAPPRPGVNGSAKKVALHKMKIGDVRSPFENCPLTDFTDRKQHDAFAAAVSSMRQTLPRHVPVVVGGKKVEGRRVVDRESPNDTSVVVANVSYATRDDADAAVRVAREAFPAWRDKPLIERATMLEKLADRLQADRFELAALQAYEVGKPWREADADVAEAIDFCRYYARQALIELSPRKQGEVPGEDNVFLYEGRGPTVVIAPWNFPLAILTGMATAALVAGNTVILKPAEQSSAIAYQLYERIIAVGFDPRIIQFLPGDGAEVGAALVEHPHVAGIAFTGSKQVGLRIIETAAKPQAGQELVKRVVCEMGGKNAIVIDDDADLDEAVVGVLKSAFGYSGQKCSAGSRIIAVGTAYEPFVHRLVEACKSLDIAPANDPACQLGPVVDRDAFERLGGVVKDPGPGARPLYVGAPPANLNGYFIAPAVFEVSDSRHRLMCDEFFGPVLAVMKADTFEGAINIANESAYKLTGAVFSRSPVNLEVARQKFRVGNLYLNRGSTGAMVDRQPFGGFGMSGGGTKAGGPNYLLQLVDPRVVTENTMRRGMTPELTE
jgi:RHH-type proline utilization regulon transcriptional repressor/proline dehydrogenase/delta 1-pyrroline-5-carboxylate dehydrogenase